MTITTSVTAGTVARPGTSLNVALDPDDMPHVFRMANGLVYLAAGNGRCHLTVTMDMTQLSDLNSQASRILTEARP